MLTAILIFIVTYVLIASEKVDKTLAALMGSVVMIVSHAVPYERALTAIDMNVIFLLMGMMMIVGVLAQTGVFEWLAIHLARLARGNGLVIMCLFLLMTAVGAALSLLYDILCLAKQAFGGRGGWISDALFALCALLLILLTMLRMEMTSLRAYVLLGAAAGWFLYAASVSRFFHWLRAKFVSGWQKRKGSSH